MMKVGLTLLFIAGSLLSIRPVFAQREGAAQRYYVWMAALPVAREKSTEIFGLVEAFKSHHATDLQRTALALGCRKVMLASQLEANSSWLLFRTECKKNIQQRLFERVAPDW